MPTFVFETDAIPETWQFLNGLRRDDLIAELIQNELDAGSTSTQIIFERDRLICEGNGEPIDKVGWTRLSFFRGAGDRVPRKRAKTGVKNHGLKACFTIADDIIIRSAGKYTQQTLRDPERAPNPHPGAMQSPEDDPAAPKAGCRIEVPYRTTDLHVNAGEPLTFSALDEHDIEELFEAACAELPQRFLGVVRPRLRSSYEIVVSHWKHGTRRFLFSAKARPKSSASVFTRTCRIVGNESATAETLHEQAYLFSLPSDIAGTHEIPEFYEKRGGFLAEVSWRVDLRGRPVYEPGQLRYPIAYVGGGVSASSGVFASYSAPFVSDAERHGISEQPFNKEVLRHCDEAFLKVIGDELLPRHGPSVLALVCNDNIDRERRRKFLELLLEHRVIPIVGKPRRGKQVRILRESRSSKGKWYFVIPRFTGDETRVSRQLAAVCPTEEKQIHPKTPSAAIGDLAGNVYDDRSLSSNENSPYTVFDENDVVSLLKGETEDQPDFPWNENWEKQFSTPQQAKVLFDVLYEIDKRKSLDDSDCDAIKGAWKVPDDHGTRTSLSDLYCSREVIDFPPGVHPPALIHHELRDHRLLRKKRWKLRSFGVAELLENVALDEAPDSTRKRFWEWTKRNWGRIPLNHRRRFAEFPIWPTIDGKYVTLSDLCYPKRQDIRRILRSVLHLPARAVLRLATVRVGGKGALGISSKVPEGAIRAWFEKRTGVFESGQKLSKSQRDDFQRFEAEAAVCAKDPVIASVFRDLQSQAFALDQTGTLRECTELHRETPSIHALELRSEDLICRSQTVLDRIFEPRNKPSTDALRRAMQHAPKNTATWLFRLAAHVKAAEREGDSPVIDDIACIPVDGKWWKPTELALQGRRGDFWGNWKKTISVKGRSAEEQDILRKVGVVPGEPTSGYSHGFFQWLEHSEPPELQENLERIVRHFDHSQGVLAWWKYYQNTRCLPVRDDRTMRLVSFAHAVRANSRVCIDDFPELANRMREKRTDRFFVIDRHPKLDASITGRIRDEPIQRLSRIAGQPVRVRSIGECEGDSELNVMMKHFQAGKFKREMKSRLAQWDIPAQHLRSDWHKRISAIRQIALCREVVADFRVGAYYYDIQLAFQFDEPSGTLFVVDREGDKMTALFDAVSNYIFRIDTPKMAKAAFEKVVLTKLPEFEHLGPGPFADAVDAESLDGGTEDETTDDITESRRTHRWPLGSESRNLPQPQQLSRSVQVKAGSTTASGDGKSRPKCPVRMPSNLEETHKQQLKEIYAWHCQVCLATKTPQELAPEGSYVFFQENRRCLIEAHHPDQVHARGARHGGNLLVVCQFHHRQFGDAISRSQFTNALQTAANSREVSYTLGSGANEKLNGVVIEVPVLTTGKTLPFFFANEHRKYWIEIDERKPGADTQHVG